MRELESERYIEIWCAYNHIEKTNFLEIRCSCVSSRSHKLSILQHGNNADRARDSTVPTRGGNANATRRTESGRWHIRGDIYPLEAVHFRCNSWERCAEREILPQFKNSAFGGGRETSCNQAPHEARSTTDGHFRFVSLLRCGFGSGSCVDRCRFRTRSWVDRCKRGIDAQLYRIEIKILSESRKTVDEENRKDLSVFRSWDHPGPTNKPIDHNWRNLLPDVAPDFEESFSIAQRP